MPSAMPSPRDEEFIRFAIAGRYLTPEQGAETLAALREIAEQGATATAPEVLVRRGALQEREAALILQATASSKLSTQVPRELGPFELLEPIGQGGMGTVFKARQKDPDRLVALKVLAPRLARDAAFVERFRRAARAAARLSHPSIVPTIDFGESDGFFYLAMEYVEGETLAQALRRERRLPEARALAIAAEVARALECAERSGIVHLGLKPENILLASDGSVRVTDFALAQALGQDAPSAGEPEQVLRAPAYVAPEVFRGAGEPTWRADTFSLGVILFEMLAGEPPFRGSSRIAVAAAVLTEPLPPLGELNPDVTAGTCRAIERMTAKDSADRFALPEEVTAALESPASAPAARPAPVAVVMKEAPAARRAAEAIAAAAPAVSPGRRAAQLKARRAGAVVATIFGISVNVLIFIFLFPIVFRQCKEREEKRAAAQAQTPPTPSVTVVAPPPLPGPRTTIAVVPPPTAVVPPPTPAPPKATNTVDARILDSLRSAVAGARDFARKNPGAYLGQVSRLQQVLEDFGGAKRQYVPEAGQGLLAEVRQELDRLKEAAKTAAEAELRQRRARADALFKEAKFADAAHLFETFPAELRLDALAPEIDRLREHYPRQGLEDFKAADAQGRKLIAEGRLEEARAAYLAIKHWQLPQATRRVAEAIADIDKQQAADKAQAEAAAREGYPKAAQAILERLGAREFAEGVKLADAAAADPKLASVRSRLGALQTLAHTAAEVWDRVAAALKATRAGEEVAVGGLTAKFVRIDGDKVYLEADSAVLVRPLADLKKQETLALAEKGLGAGGADADLKIGLFLFAEQDYAEAGRRFAAAKEKGADVTQALYLMARLAPRVCPECKGARIVPCTFCGGTGFMAAEYKECPACKGAGGTKCARCGGKGTVASAGRQVPCPNCEKGVVPCKRCKGTGTLTIPVVCEKCKGKKEAPCGTCDGKGSLPPLDLLPPEASK